MTENLRSSISYSETRDQLEAELCKLVTPDERYNFIRYKFDPTGFENVTVPPEQMKDLEKSSFVSYLPVYSHFHNSLDNHIWIFFSSFAIILLYILDKLQTQICNLLNIELHEFSDCSDCAG